MTLWLLAALAHAGPAPTIDLEEATRIALDRGVDLEQASIAVAEREIAVRTSQLAWLPNLSARMSGQASLGRTFSEQLGANVTEPVASLAGSLSTSMPLYQGGLLAAQRREAAAWLEVERQDEAQVRQDVVWAVADALLAIGEAQADVDVRRAALGTAEALEAQVAAFVEAGTRIRADLHAQRAEVEARRAELASAEQGLREAELNLALLLRLDPGQSWTIEPPREVPSLPTDTSTLVRMALSDRPALASRIAAVEANEAAARAARAASLPSVSLGASLSSSYLTSNPHGFETQLRDQYRASASVDLSVPIFDRGVNRARRQAADLAVERAALGLASWKEELEVEVRRIQSAREAAAATLTAAEARVASAEQAARVLELRYEAGSADLVALTDARAKVVEAEVQRVRSASQLRRTAWLLAWTVGALG